MRVPILIPATEWHCPKCGAEDVTREAEPHTRFHQCRAMGGFDAPMARGGMPAKAVVHEREDYIGTEDVRLDENGRPIMNITLEYADGHTDVAVYAATAHAGGTA